MSKVKVHTPAAFRPLYAPKRYKVFYGGRGSGKSWAIAQALVARAIERPTRILCARELQKSISESVHRLLTDTIDRMGVAHLLNYNKTSISGVNGSTFYFSGVATNVTGIKSMEGIDIVWLEEAENISDNSWTILIPTFRATGSEIWVSFNPFDELDATYQRFVAPYLERLESHGQYEDDRRIITKVNYNQNPYFNNTELRQEMLDDKANNHHKYLHVWEGNLNADYDDSIIKPEWINAAIDAHKTLGFDALGVTALGFDPADTGKDNKALVHRHGSVVRNLESWVTEDITAAIDRALSYALTHNINALVFDGIGVGAAVKDRVNTTIVAPNLKVDNFIGSHQPDNPDKKYKNDMLNLDVFKNKRAQYWWYLRDRFYQTFIAVTKNKYIDPTELISLPADLPHLKQLKSELVRVQRKRSNTQQIQIESKIDMAKRGVASPGIADALVYAFAAKGFTMGRTNANEFDDWNTSIN